MRHLLIGLLLAFLTVNVSYAIEPELPKDTPPVIVPKEKPKQDTPKEPSGAFTKLPSIVDCSSAETVRSLLDKYNEIPFAKFTVIVQIPNGQILQQPGSMFVNPVTGSWSIVALFPENGMACIVQGGTYFAPASGGNKKAT